MKILVDVDGCLNYFGELGPEGSAFYVIINNTSFPIQMDFSFGPKLLRLSEETDAELMWCTMWENEANIYLCEKLGWPELPYIKMHRKFSDYSVVGIKARNIDDQLNDSFVWFDDDPEIDYLTSEYFRFPYKVVRTDDLTGITDDDILKARQWLNEQNRITGKSILR